MRSQKMSNIDLNKSTYNELEAIFNHSTKLVFKDMKEATANETQDSLISSDAVISSYLKTDKLTDAQRMANIASYNELNPYYKNLETSFGINPIIARLADDLEILKEPPYPVNSILAYFNVTYLECLRYFYSTVYTVALENEPNYRNFCKLAIVMMTILKVLARKNSTPYDINFMDDYSLDQFMYSFGIPYFKEFPVRYKRLVVQNLNRLITEKGTTDVIVSILDIFDFNNIDIYKHYLVKNTSNNIDKFDNVVNDAKFYIVNIKENSLIDAIKKDAYRVEGFNDNIAFDEHWEVTKEEVESYDFDFVNSKYFSIESSYDIFEESATTMYFLNYVKSVRQQYPAQDLLTFRSSFIGEGDYRLEDLIVAINIFILKSNGVVSDDIFFPASNAIPFQVYGFKLNDSSSSVFNSPDSILKSIDPFDNIDQPLFIQNTRHNLQVRKNILNSLKYEPNAKIFKEKLRVIRDKLQINYDNTLFVGYATYSDYLQAVSPDLLQFVQNAIDNHTISEDLTILVDILTEFVNSNKLMLNSSSLTPLIQTLKSLINVFKSFSTTLKDIRINIRAKEDFFFKFTEYVTMISQISLNDRFTYNDVLRNREGTLRSNDRQYLSDSFVITVTNE